MKVPSETKRSWENRFPGLSGKWTHWKITGTGTLLAVVDGADLLSALRVVEDNYGRYITIKANRVSVDSGGSIVEEEASLYEISNLSLDEKAMRAPRAEDA